LVGSARGSQAVAKTLAPIAALIPEPRLVPIDQIKFDSRYQKDLRQRVVVKIVKNFDPKRLGVAVLSHRDNALWCVDAMHRVCALRELGMTHIYAIVYEGLTPEQEAVLWAELNDVPMSPNVWERYRSDLFGKVQDAVAVDRAVTAAGFLIQRQGAPNSIQAIGALRRVFALGGAYLIGRTLELLRVMVQVDRRAVDGKVLTGVAMFLWSCERDLKFDRTRVERILTERPAAQLIGRARSIAREMREQEETSGLSSQYVARAIVEYYNQGIPKSKKLGGVILGRGDRTSSPRVVRDTSA
jgi:hypothetical protein